jgi:hypothetical protein
MRACELGSVLRGAVLLALLVGGGGQQEADESESGEGDETHDEDRQGDLLWGDCATGGTGTR